jgi:8-oxo-dGTP pyrophosphatase MutT (NUDIX family)
VRQPLPVPASPNPYRVTDRKVLFDSPWIRLREDRIEHRCGGKRQYAVCGFRRTACGVLALDEQDRVVLVGQWRYPLETYSWELPEGGGEEWETPLETIQRELEEEAGLQAALWEPLSFFHTSNSSTDEEVFLFLAQDLAPAGGGHGPEDTEELACLREPFDACVARALSGEITDSLTVVALLTLQARRLGAPAVMDPAVAERFFQRPDQHPSPGRARWGKLELP